MKILIPFFLILLGQFTYASNSSGVNEEIANLPREDRDLSAEDEELANEIETRHSNTLRFINRHGGGGNIDGGGTEVQYPPKEDLHQSLKEALFHITNKEEGKNFLRRLRDSYPNHSIRGIYTNFPDFIADATDRLNLLRLTSPNEAFLQMLVGDSFQTMIESYRTCHFYKKEALNLYSDDVTLVDTATCDNISFNNPSHTLDFIKPEIFEFKDQCFDSFGEEKIGSVSSFSLKAKVCLSYKQFLKVPKNVLLKTILAIMLHEVSHMFGSSEAQAKDFEDFIFSKVEPTLKSINNLESEIDDRRSDIILKFINMKLNLYPATMLSSENFFNYSYIEKEIRDIFHYEIVNFDELFFLFPFTSVTEFNSHFEELRAYIGDYFHNIEGDFFYPRTDVFTENEILLLKGTKPINTAEGDRFIKKMNNFLKGANKITNKIYDTLSQVPAGYKLTNRQDIMKYIDSLDQDPDTLYYHDKWYFYTYENFEYQPRPNTTQELRYPLP